MSGNFIEAEIYKAIKDCPNLGKRVYPEAPKLGTKMPYITYKQISGVQIERLANMPAQQYRFQFDIVAKSLKEAKEVTTDLFILLQVLSGRLDSEIVSRIDGDNGFFIINSDYTIFNINHFN